MNDLVSEYQQYKETTAEDDYDYDDDDDGDVVHEEFVENMKEGHD